MSDAPHGLAAAVRAALDSSGLTVEDVSAETRIRAVIVRDLVAGRTESSHGDVYVRGHLKAIAHATGTDPAPLLRALELQTGAVLALPDLDHTVHLHGQTVGSLGLPLAAPPERRGPRWGVALVAAAAVLMGLVGVGNLVGEAGSSRADEPRPTPSVTTRAPAPVPTTRPPAPRPPTGAVLSVRITGGSSWVQVKRGGSQKVFEGILEAGAVKDFRDAAALSVRVGNAGAVRLTCGGRVFPAGAAGQVKAFRCAPGGLSPV